MLKDKCCRKKLKLAKSIFIYLTFIYIIIIYIIINIIEIQNLIYKWDVIRQNSHSRMHAHTHTHNLNIWTYVTQKTA